MKAYVYRNILMKRKGVALENVIDAFRCKPLQLASRVSQLDGEERDEEPTSEKWGVGVLTRGGTPETCRLNARKHV